MSDDYYDDWETERFFYEELERSYKELEEENKRLKEEIKKLNEIIQV